MAIQSFEQLEVWQKAHALTLEVYRLTAKFPTEEKFGLVSQMRRAAVAVPANIAEGFKRSGKLDKVRFYNIAHASLEELRYYFILSQDLGLIKDVTALKTESDTIGRMLTALCRAVIANPR
jgi:four helix bundle protein